MEHGLNFIHSLECCVLEILVTFVSKDEVDHGGHHLMRIPVHMTLGVCHLNIETMMVDNTYGVFAVTLNSIPLLSTMSDLRCVN